MNYKSFTLYKLAKKTYLEVVRSLCEMRRKPLIPKVKALVENKFHSSHDEPLSIISTNCFAGRIMQDLKMEYNSPTLGLYFMYPDYIEFLQNLPFYLKEAKIEFVESSKYPIGNERRAKWSHWYPIGLLDGKVEIHFLHYHTEEEAASKWYRRAARVNLNNMLIIGMEQNLCSVQDIEAFDKLPYKNKIIFTTKPLQLKSNEYMPEFKASDQVGDPYLKGHIFYQHLIEHFAD